MKTIRDVEAQGEEKLSMPLKELGLLPEGYRCSVRLRGKSRDKRRTASFENTWSPDTDSIYIQFERTLEGQPEALQPVAQGAANPSPNIVAKSDAAPTSPLSDLIRALDRAESRPGYSFVALKWFRDKALPSEGFPWVSDESETRKILLEAIEKRLVLTSKVPNPKSPQFPVTAIRLNRLMPRVKAILGSGPEGGPDFQPVSIRGEDLSVTLLRDRR